MITCKKHLIFAVFARSGVLELCAKDEPPIRYAFQVFQLKGSLTKPIWNGDEKHWDVIKDEVRLFDEGEFLNGTDRLVMTPKSCFWNDQELTFEEGHQTKLPEKKVKMIFSPNLVRKEKELVRLKITSKRRYEYMSPRKDGLFELLEAKLPRGLDIEIKAHRTAKKTYAVSHLECDLRSVNRREKLQESTLPIGKPILDESEYILKLKVQEYRSSAVVMQPKDSDTIIIVRFEIDDN